MKSDNFFKEEIMNCDMHKVVLHDVIYSKWSILWSEADM